MQLPSTTLSLQFREGPRAMARMQKKANLPSKDCAACGRPFSWRKKWARDWENVRYCSDACRTGAYGRARAKGAD
jgi:hypothetical protein